jgi:hypothetical protein
VTAEGDKLEGLLKVSDGLVCFVRPTIAPMTMRITTIAAITMAALCFVFKAILAPLT